MCANNRRDAFRAASRTIISIDIFRVVYRRDIIKINNCQLFSKKYSFYSSIFFNIICHVTCKNFVTCKKLKAHCYMLPLTKEVLVRRNSNFAAQAETYEFSVRCSVTNLIFELTFCASFITMQHELHNKASIFKFQSLAARQLNDTVKYKGFNDFFP